jgi:hypothetical protein
MEDILAVKGPNAKKKENSALNHFNYFIEEFYSHHMPEDRPTDPTGLFQCNGPNGKGLNYAKWDDMFCNFMYYLAEYTTKGCK